MAIYLALLSALAHQTALGQNVGTISNSKLPTVNTPTLGTTSDSKPPTKESPTLGTDSNSKPPTMESPGTDANYKPPTTTVTTAPSLTPETITPEIRGSVLHWHQSMHWVHQTENNLFRSYCNSCDAEKIREYTQGEKEALETHTIYWGFNVNREFGEVDYRSCGCVNQVVRSWARWEDFAVKDPDTAALEIRGGTARNLDRCGKTLDVLASRPGFNVDQRCDARDNSMDIAMRSEHLDIAEYLIQIGEKRTAREGIVDPDICSHKCTRGLAPNEAEIEVITRFEKEKRTEKNQYDYDYALQLVDRLTSHYKWCKFFAGNHLRCPKHDRREVMPKLFTDESATTLQQYAGAEIRQMFEIEPAEGDKDILKNGGSVWNVMSHQKLAGIAEEKDEKKFMKPDINV